MILKFWTEKLWEGNSRSVGWQTAWSMVAHRGPVWPVACPGPGALLFASPFSLASATALMHEQIEGWRVADLRASIKRNTNRPYLWRTLWHAMTIRDPCCWLCDVCFLVPQVISFGDKPFRGEQQNHLLVRFGISTDGKKPNLSSEYYTYSYDSYLFILDIVTWTNQTTSNNLSFCFCRFCLGLSVFCCFLIGGWCSALQFGVATKQHLYPSAQALYRAWQDLKWSCQKAMHAPWWSHSEYRCRRSFSV